MKYRSRMLHAHFAHDTCCDTFDCCALFPIARRDFDCITRYFDLSLVAPINYPLTVSYMASDDHLRAARESATGEEDCDRARAGKSRRSRGSKVSKGISSVNTTDED